MGSRYTSIKNFDYCFTPLTISRNNELITVPCGKCDGCLLHKANLWSARLSNEIDGSLCSLFITLTYNNKYLPTLVPVEVSPGKFSWISDHSENIRFDGVKDKKRLDHIVLEGFSSPDQIVRAPENMPGVHLSYASKRDVQLWLKMVRKSIDLNFPDNESRNLRYFAISEYGPTTYRNHLHILLFFQSHEVASFVLEHAAYENWKMCDKTLFNQYSRFCNSGVGNYVTNYVTGFSRLPSILKSSEIRPFRLSSKGFAIGFDSFDEEKFLESITSGTLTYSKRVERLGSTSVLRYPQGYISSLFPKVDQFSLLDFGRLLEIYGAAYFQIRRARCEPWIVFNRLRKSLSAVNYRCTRKCYEFCVKYQIHPYLYVWFLDQLYYKLAMSNLEYFYSFQEEYYVSDPLRCMHMYSNLGEFVTSHWHSNDDYELKVARFFFDGFCIDFDGISDIRDFLVYDYPSLSDYRQEVEDIVEKCIKIPKFNEEFGLAPHIV